MRVGKISLLRHPHQEMLRRSYRRLLFLRFLMVLILWCLLPVTNTYVIDVPPAHSCCTFSWNILRRVLHFHLDQRYVLDPRNHVFSYALDLFLCRRRFRSYQGRLQMPTLFLPSPLSTCIFGTKCNVWIQPNQGRTCILPLCCLV